MQQLALANPCKCPRSTVCPLPTSLPAVVRSIVSAIGFSALQEWVFKIPGFTYGGWMTFITYLTYATCGWIETAVTRNTQRHGHLRVSDAGPII